MEFQWGLMIKIFLFSPRWFQISRFLPIYNRLGFFFIEGPSILKPYLPQLLQLFRYPPSNLSFREKRIKTYLHRISVSLLSPHWRVFNQELKIAWTEAKCGAFKRIYVSTSAFEYFWNGINEPRNEREYIYIAVH